MVPDIEQLEREDLVMFINAAGTCTGQSEFYGADAEQRLPLTFLHEYVFGNYRRLYASCLVAGINHYNQALVIERLLRAGRPRQADLAAHEGERIRFALRTLPPQRVYRLFDRLRRSRVNNRRSRAVLREWLATRDLTFDAVKYRGLLRSCARHAHLTLPNEVHGFLFEGSTSRKQWSTALFDSFRRAHYDGRAIYELPFTVAEGLAAAKGIDRTTFLKRIEPRMTRGEKARLHRSRDELGIGHPDDVTRMPVDRATAAVLSLPIQDRTDWESSVRASARRLDLRGIPERVHVVLDNSYSSRGGAQKRNRPLAMALALALAVEEQRPQGRVFWTGHQGPSMNVRPKGPTDLAGPLLDALQGEPDLILVVSDGYENTPRGAAAEVVRLVRESPHLPSTTRIIHLNPVFDATSWMPRCLGPSVPTVGLHGLHELSVKIAFASFTLGTTTLTELETWILSRTESSG